MLYVTIPGYSNNVARLPLFGKKDEKITRSKAFLMLQYHGPILMTCLPTEWKLDDESCPNNVFSAWLYFTRDDLTSMGRWKVHNWRQYRVRGCMTVF